jgi:predicted TIM-barrel fold metal-dependent hydrolase
MFLADGVVHAFDLRPANDAHQRYGRVLAESLYKAQLHLSGEFAIADRDDYIKDWSVSEVLGVVFDESGIDVAAFHTLAMYDLYTDGMCAADKGAEAVARYGNRVLWYAGIDPFDQKRARYQIDEFADRGAAGLKFLPSRWVERDVVSFDFSDRPSFYPLLEAAQSRGIQNIAVHKAVPVGPASVNTAALEDLWSPARDFPEMNFQIIHGGMAFVDETAALMGRCRNVYCTLETTWSLLVAQPRRFAEAVGVMLREAGADRLIYGDGCMNVHPVPGLRAFADFQIPDDLQVGRGMPALSQRDRELILGGNLARLHAIDTAVAGAINEART